MTWTPPPPLPRDHLCFKAADIWRWILLGVTGHVPTAQVFDGHVFDVEPDVVPRQSRLQALVVHLNWLDLCGELGWREHQGHAGFEDACFNLPHWHSPNSWRGELISFCCPYTTRDKLWKKKTSLGNRTGFYLQFCRRLAEVAVEACWLFAPEAE